MSTKVRKRTSPKKVVRFKRKRRIRADVFGTAARPRMAIFKSNAHIYVQLIDDSSGTTVLSDSTYVAEDSKLRANLDGAKVVGKNIAAKALSKNIAKVVFDRSGYQYHGKIKALADAAREAGLQF